MSTPPTPPPAKPNRPGARAPSARRGSAGSRRARYLALTSVLMLAVSAVCVFGVLLASRHPVRWDMTATREHQLSDRTRNVLARLNGPHEIVVVANRATLDPRALERTQSVLGAMERESRNVSASFIDAGSARGQSELDAVLARLNDRYRASSDAAIKSLGTSITAARGIASDSEKISAQLQAIQDTLPEPGSGATAENANAAALKRFFADSASVLRVAAHDLTQACTSGESLLSTPIAGTGVIPTAQAAATVRVHAANTLRQIEQASQSAAAIASSDAKAVSPDLRQKTAPIAQALGKLRDQAARLLLDLDQVPRTPLESVARVVTSTSAVLVIAPPGGTNTPVGGVGSGGVTAIDLATLLPPRIEALQGTVQPDLRFRSEELLAGALASLSQRDAPIVCLVHGAPTATRLNADSPLIAGLAMRLRLRGIDIVEWPASDAEQPIGLREVDPTGTRPVVYVVVPINAMAGAEGATRSAKLNTAVARLVGAGKPVLLSLNPSNLPAIGQPDPAVEFLAPLGIKPDTGHPLLRKENGGARGGGGSGGSFVTPDLLLMRTDPEHPAAQAAQSLRTYLTWALPIVIEPSKSDAYTLWPLFTVADDGSVWGEADWLAFRQTPPEQRAALLNPPSPDSVRDDKNGPWIVAVAWESKQATGAQVRNPRLIVVGANGWFFDEFTQVAYDVQGQHVFANPGNLEFFEASVYWLAGQDEFIARSADAQAAALIPALAPAKLATLRWVLIAGLPLIVLLCGALWRALRG